MKRQSVKVRSLVFVAMLAVGLSVVVLLLLGSTGTSASMPGAVTDSASLAQANSTSCEREFITAGTWTSPPDYHGNPFAPGGVGAAWWWVFEPLFVYVPASGETIPRLGVSFEQVTDTFTVTLQTNAFWHDGTPFTSKDVWSTFMLGYLYDWSIWGYLDTIETPDDYTVVFHWETPTILGKQFMGRRIICAPYHLYGTWADLVGPAMGDEAALDAIRQNLEAFKPAIPIGTGPFQMDTVAETEMMLTKFSQHYSADNVDFDKVKIVSWTSNDRVKLLLETGQIDAAHPGLLEEEVNEILAAQPTMKFALPSDLAGFSLAFNLREAPFNDVRFRKAIAYAISREELAEVTLWVGLPVADYATGLLESLRAPWVSDEWMEENLTDYSYNSDEAATLLEELGYEKGEDGIWEDGEGNDLSFGLVCHAGYSDWVLAIENMASQLNEFGILIETETRPGSVYWSSIRAGDFDFCLEWTMTSWGYAHPWAELRRTLHVDGDTAKTVDITAIDLIGPEGGPVDTTALIDELGAEFDLERQKELVATLAWIHNENLPVLPFVEKRLMIFHLDKVRVTNWPDNDDPIWSVAPGGIERVYSTLMTEGRIRSYPFCIFLPTVLKNAGGP
jgi:peptide/nickel transport system substrate-binding protein